ncbi:hypothetical protein DdX_03563 [Ditylenchus destructor]|uniref:Transmembrane protein n=1 Tax=Ditylenchus destructor TaxID=166010 RepID=A0AAD4NFK1_9BILA|nr:hypothetical protein DdX_03563 [Ditylenchus destructor]
MANSGTCGSSGVRLTTCASAPIMGDCGNENGNSNNRIRQTLRQQRQHTTETCLDESQCDWNTEEEDFWVTIASLRASFYGISMWCIGWNVVAIVLSPTKVWRFAPVLFLGIMLSVTALHTQRVYISRRYSNLFVLIPFCFSYTMCGVSIILRSVGDALESITYNDELTEFSFDRHTARISMLSIDHTLCIRKNTENKIPDIFYSSLPG